MNMFAYFRQSLPLKIDRVIAQEKLRQEDTRMKENNKYLVLFLTGIPLLKKFVFTDNP